MHFFGVEAVVSVVVGSEVVGSEIVGSEVVDCRVCIRRSGRVYGFLILYVDVALSVFG
jgi:hypothetical protein